MITLTYFTARSTQVAHAFEWGKLSKCHLKKNALWKWANGLKIYDSKKELDPRGRSAHTPGQYTCILTLYSKNFFSETAWPIKAKLNVEHSKDGRMKFI